MGFNSIAFAVFLPLVFGIYWALAGGSLRRQNLFVLLASYVFYGWWDKRFLALILISSATDYWVGRALHRATSRGHRKALLLVSIGVNIGILGFFKYYDFFVESLVDAFALAGARLDARTLGIVLPVGISFYTFQTLSYTIDIFRGRIEPATDSVSFFSFVAFFPQLVAGPIERASNLLPQFQRRRVFAYERAVSGLRLILWGFFKKIVIADRLAPFVDTVFAPQADHQGSVVLLGGVAFAFQVYCDFSGYSDIAIGTARLFGFELTTNFRTPLFAGSLQDLWRRWHVSLSTWFRDYVYTPLGGNRRGTARWLVNILLTFTVAGLWHGARLNLPVWGFFLGVTMCVERLAVRALGARFRLRGGLAVAATFATFAFSLIIFRAHDLGHATRLVVGVFAGGGTGSLADGVDAAFAHPLDAVYLLLSLVLLLLVDLVTRRGDVNVLFDAVPGATRWLLYYFFVGWILLFGEFNTAPSFIYFQF